MAEDDTGADTPESSGGTAKPVIKKYRVQTPIKIDVDKTIKEGAVIKLDVEDAAELVAVGAIVEA